MIDMEKMADLAHTMLCVYPHEYDVNGDLLKDSCLYYMEESMDEKWEQKDHKVWLDKTRELSETIHTEEDMEKFLKICGEIVSCYNLLMSKYKENVRTLTATVLKS